MNLNFPLVTANEHQLVSVLGEWRRLQGIEPSALIQDHWTRVVSPLREKMITGGVPIKTWFGFERPIWGLSLGDEFSNLVDDVVCSDHVNRFFVPEDITSSKDLNEHLQAHLFISTLTQFGIPAYDLELAFLHGVNLQPFMTQVCSLLDKLLYFEKESQLFARLLKDPFIGSNVLAVGANHLLEQANNYHLFVNRQRLTPYLLGTVCYLDLLGLAYVPPAAGSSIFEPLFQFNESRLFDPADSVSLRDRHPAFEECLKLIRDRLEKDTVHFESRDPQSLPSEGLSLDVSSAQF